MVSGLGFTKNSLAQIKTVPVAISQKRDMMMIITVLHEDQESME